MSKNLKTNKKKNFYFFELNEIFVIFLYLFSLYSMYFCAINSNSIAVTFTKIPFVIVNLIYWCLSFLICYNLYFSYYLDSSFEKKIVFLDETLLDGYSYSILYLFLTIVFISSFIYYGIYTDLYILKTMNIR